MKTFSEWLEQREELFLIDLNEGLNDLSVVKISRDPLNITQIYKILKDNSYKPNPKDGATFAKILKNNLDKIVISKDIPKYAPENIKIRKKIADLFELRFGQDYETYLITSQTNNSTKKVFRTKANAFRQGGPWAGAS